MRRAITLVRAGPSGWLLVSRMLAWWVALRLLRKRVALPTLVELAACPRSTPNVIAQRRTLRLAYAFYRKTEGTCLERSLLLFRISAGRGRT